MSINSFSPVISKPISLLTRRQQNHDKSISPSPLSIPNNNTNTNITSRQSPKKGFPDLINLIKKGGNFNPSKELLELANTHKIPSKKSYTISLPLKPIKSNSSRFSLFSDKLSFSTQKQDETTEKIISTSPTTKLLSSSPPFSSPVKRSSSPKIISTPPNSTVENKLKSTSVYIPLPKRKDSVNWDINKIQNEHKQPTEQIKQYLKSMNNHTPFTLNHELRGLYNTALADAIKKDISAIGENYSELSTQVIHYLDRIKDFSLPPSGCLLYTTAAAKAAQSEDCVKLRTEAFLHHAQALIDNQQKQAALPYLTKAKNYLGSSDFHITKEDIEKKIDTLKTEVRAKTF